MGLGAEKENFRVTSRLASKRINVGIIRPWDLREALSNPIEVEEGFLWLQILFSLVLVNFIRKIVDAGSS